MTDSAASPADATAVIRQAIPMLGHLGLEVLSMEPGRMTLRVPFAGNQNHVGTMYAGALFAIAEVPGGAIAVQLFDPTIYYPVIRSMTVDYRRPATTDVTVDAHIDAADADRIRAEADANGKADFVMNLEVTDTGGTVVMTSRGEYQLRRHRPAD
ncbi:MAG: YiiD C-terminal domain-containing protein [Candidatus Nanopelagicales bacterium]